MDPQPYTQSASNEAKLILAIQAIRNDASLSERKAAELYDVDRMRLNRRRAGIAARRDCQANSKKLTKLEEEVIIKFIIELDTRGFSPTLAAV
jgi:molybdate-binding protein